MEKLSKGKLVNSGMGGFLNPPGHPEHYYSIQSLSHNGEDFAMCLSFAAECEWLDDETRKLARDKLATFVKTSLYNSGVDNPAHDWVRQVLGYFRNCYSRNGSSRNANDNNATSIGETDAHLKYPLRWHLGVMHIREYYPEYIISKSDFQKAYWGTNKENKSYDKAAIERLFCKAEV